MTSIRLTEFTAARPEQRNLLEGFVRDGQRALVQSPDCLGCEAFHDADDPSRIVAIERWTDLDARHAAARLIPPAVVQGAMALMRQAPLSRSFTATGADASAVAAVPVRRINVGLIVASVRNERFGPIVANWFGAIIAADKRFNVEVIDLAAVDLPAALPADPGDLSVMEKRPAHLRPVSAALGKADAFVIVTPEYNHGLPASLKHFIDWHFVEWQRKPAAAIGYGGLGGGIRAIENLRLVLAELHATVIRDTVTLNAPWELFAENGDLLDPTRPTQAARLLCDSLAWWATTLREGRAGLRGREA